MPAKPVLYLIDGSSQMYRAFHAPVRTGEGSLLRNAQGLPTNAVYIFVTMLRKLLKEHAPQYIAASFDLPGRTFRDDLAADYKANRAPMPGDLAAQIPLVHRACEALGVPIVTQERYEADDVIGTLTVRALAKGFDVAIVTGDKDFFQLVDDRVRVFNPRDDGTWYDAVGVKEKFGVAPEQVVDVLALMGDTIDNVKGVPGIGEKGARDLISTHGTLDALLANAAQVPQKKYREALLNHADEARSSRELLRIHTDIAVDIDVATLNYRGPSREDCYRLFSEMGFRTLVNEYAPDARNTASDYALITTSDQLVALVAELRGAKRLAIKVVGDGTSTMSAGVAGIVISDAPHRARYVPTGHRPRGSVAPDAPVSNGALFDLPAEEPAVGLPLQQVIDALRPLLEDSAIEKIGHDLKADMILLERNGVELRGLGLDTMLGSYLLDSTRSGHDLESTALDFLGYRAQSEIDVCGKGAKAISLAEVEPAAVLTFAGERTDLSLQLADRLSPDLKDAQLEKVYSDLEQPLIPVLAAIEQAGVRVDRAALAVQGQQMERELASLQARIHDLAGEQFNVNSPPQLARILFEKLQLPALKKNVKTKTPSTAVEVLEELALSHDMPRLILEWRGLQKLKGTYVDALPLLVNPRTGRVHTSFNQAVAATGRLSSSDPNLQNIPIRTAVGREIRRAFVADPGHVLISADYSQIELRVLAHLAGDETLTTAFRNGEDIHDQTALKVFGPASGLDPHELRRRAKIINYALLYGKTAFTLAKDIGVTQEAAQHFIDAYFAGFPRVRAFIDRTLEDARASGAVRTLFGRRRLVPELNSPNWQDRSRAERETVNMPIQGTAADILKRAMIDVHAALAQMPDARMILTVHDELLFEVRESRADEVAAIVRDRMQGAAALVVPLTVDVGIDQNWRDAKP
ncbi:MAG: DNA polymerase I [Vicinamibacterales bacterium]